MFSSLRTIQIVFFGIFMVLYLGASIFHLVASYKENKRLRRISKPFLLLFLGSAIVSINPSAYLLYIGAYLGAIGDTLLIKKEKKFLLTGLISFFLGHLSYIAYILISLFKAGALPYWGIILVASAFLVIGIIAIPFMKVVCNGNKPLSIGGGFYLSVLLTLFSVTILGSSIGFGSYMAFSVIGAFLFIVSDTLLVFTLFRHDIKRKDFYIMLTYLLAELSILFGLVFTIF